MSFRACIRNIKLGRHEYKIHNSKAKLNFLSVIALVSEELGAVGSHVEEVAHVEAIVGVEPIGIDDAVGPRLLLYDRQEGSGSYVGNDRSVENPTPVEQTEYRHLASGSTTSLTLVPASEVALVGLDFHPELLAGKNAGD